jgi:lysine 2,3-aminomutase
MELRQDEKVKISPKSHKLLNQLLQENPKLHEILIHSEEPEEAISWIHEWVENDLKTRPKAYKFYKRETTGREEYETIEWKDYATIRILDYTDHEGMEFVNPNHNNKISINSPFRTLWLATKFGRGSGNVYFFRDMLQLFRQYNGSNRRELPDRIEIEEWMNRHPTGLDQRIVKLRDNNRDRILRIIIEKIENGEIKNAKYKFEEGLSKEDKFKKALEWWYDRWFHLKFAVRSPELLNELMDYSLPQTTMSILKDAEKAGIPFFVNPYYLSLLNIETPDFAFGSDLAIREYVLYSRELIDEYGKIVAWEKEDIVEPGKPNAAGWLLPSSHNVHRRYPEVAILIPDTVGRACGGLCVSCQRMYDFQSGNLNFNLEKLIPEEKWKDKLKRLMKYYEDDSQLRDILITGGDALMSSDKSMLQILDEVYEMAKRKKEANIERPDGEKYAEILRVRLGTRLPAYLPQRITPELIKILKEFKDKAVKIGIKQFVIQTHFESAMEITPLAKKGIEMLLSAGWIVTNQLVFTAAASRRGHTAKLRQALNEIGVLTYYTFSVKGYMENHNNFAPNARAVQEQIEEKRWGVVPEDYRSEIKEFANDASSIVDNIRKMRENCNLPFLATDRNVINLPGVGKSLTYRTIGITKTGRRILEFDHDATRVHSPIINKMGKVIIIESKPIAKYIEQLQSMGENKNEYRDIYGYSIGETEPRMPIYEYPQYDFEITDEMTNLEITDDAFCKS